MESIWEVSAHLLRAQRTRRVPWDRIWGTLAAPHASDFDARRCVWRYWRYWQAEGRTLRVVINTARRPPRLMAACWDRGRRRLGAQL